MNDKRLLKGNTKNLLWSRHFLFSIGKTSISHLVSLSKCLVETVV